MSTGQVLLLALPVAVIQFGLLVFALLDLMKPERKVRGDNKAAWGVIIIIFSFVGPLAYFMAGRKDV